jgi:hypothetical protein
MATLKLKFNARQTASIYAYKNLKMKVINCNANTYFNRQCLNKKIFPNYARVKITRTSPTATNTQKKIQFQRIKDEIKHELCLTVLNL